MNPINPLVSAALQPAAAMPLLQPGAVLQALVLAMIDDLTLRLQLPTGTLDVPTDTPLPAGARVQVAVSGTPGAPRLTLTPLPSGANVKPTIAPVTDPALPKGTASPRAFEPETAKAILQALVSQVAARAAGKQNGFTPLLADLDAALRQSNVTVPPPVRHAIGEVFAQALDSAQPITAAQVKAAVAASGVVATAIVRTDAEPAPPGDLHGALETLRRVLTQWSEVNAPGLPLPGFRDVKGKALTSLPLLPQAVQDQTGITPMQAHDDAALPERPQPRPVSPPPHRDLAPTAQAPVNSSLPLAITPREMALHLLKDVEAALARQTLSHIASLPDLMTPSHAINNEPAPASRFVFEIPLALAQGFGVAAFRIEQDGKGKGEGDQAKPVWRADFSLALEPLGPVHARISLCGERATVTLLAERDASAAQLRDKLPMLQAALAQASLQPGELQCRLGQPHAAPAAAGLFLDRES